MISAKSQAAKIKHDLKNNQDIIIREMSFKSSGLAIIYIDEIVDIEQINLNIIGAINQHIKKVRSIDVSKLSAMLTNVAQVEEVSEYNQVLQKLLQGQAVVTVDDSDSFLVLNVTKYQSRSITEPPTSVVIKGPREGFNENIKTNIS